MLNLITLANSVKKTSSCSDEVFSAKDYLNGAELGEILPQSNVPVQLDKLEFDELKNTLVIFNHGTKTYNKSKNNTNN